MTPQLFALRAEAYIVTGLKVHKATSQVPGNRKECLSQIRTLIQDGLDTVLLSTCRTEKVVQMQYKDYEKRIVAKYSVKLVNWPLPTITQPGDITGRMDTILHLLSVLEERSCHWVSLNDDKWKTEKARIRAKVVGTSKSRTKNAKSPEMVDDKDDRDDSGASDE
ncbi:hypothetical protein BDN72DRAFT_907235 [Pluteus cervinus]|uniref:Uncharacterized protein n=1 Tax=Pluteus cervinus TaxID=181527 RepID=A0ACD2ZXA3_9AGAR|nr:hypothetical protein BDN72DRAFT_907235 [Pluteus cervinus]